MSAAPSATPAEMQSPALGSPNPWDPDNHKRGLPMLQNLHMGETKPLSPAMRAVLLLTALYYALYMLGVIERLAREGLSCCGDDDNDDNDDDVEEKKSLLVQEGTRAGAGSEGRGSGIPPTAFQRLCKNAENAMQLIPMLCVLILFARLRSKVDLEGSNPPAYAQSAFYAAAALVYTMALFQDIFFCGGPFVQALKHTLSFALILSLLVCIITIFFGIISTVKAPE